MSYFHLVFILKKFKELDYMVFFQVTKHNVKLEISKLVVWRHKSIYIKLVIITRA